MGRGLPEASEIPFPTTIFNDAASDASRMSVISIRPTALDICYSVYGEAATSVDSVDRFYEANASTYFHDDPLVYQADTF